jgi:hypothetical protein
MPQGLEPKTINRCNFLSVSSTVNVYFIAILDSSESLKRRRIVMMMAIVLMGEKLSRKTFALFCGFAEKSLICHHH